MEPPCMNRWWWIGSMEEDVEEEEAEERFLSQGMRELPSVPLLALLALVMKEEDGLGKEDEAGLGL